MGLNLKRAIDPALASNFGGAVFYPIVLVFIDWPNDPLYLHSNTGTVNWDGKEWLGVGALGSSLNVADETGGLVPAEGVVSLAGDIAFALEALNPAARESEVELWIGAVTEPGGTELVGIPYSVMAGYVAGNRLDHNPNDGTAPITPLTIRSGQPARASADIAHSDEDQQALYPGDTIFRRVAHASKWQTNPPQWPAP